MVPGTHQWHQMTRKSHQRGMYHFLQGPGSTIESFHPTNVNASCNAGTWYLVFCVIVPGTWYQLLSRSLDMTPVGCQMVSLPCEVMWLFVKQYEYKTIS